MAGKHRAQIPRSPARKRPPGSKPVSPRAKGNVTQLVGASEADADVGFMARLLALCSLPRRNPTIRASSAQYWKFHAD